MAKNKPYKPGQSPAPRNWAECAKALKSMSKSVSKRTGSSFMDRLDSVERLLKDHK